MNVSFHHLVKSSIRSLAPYQPGKSSEELLREMPVRRVIKLASNENPLGMSPRVAAAIQQVRDFSRYPDPTGYKLNNSLAERLQVSSHKIMLGNGSAEVLSTIAQAFIEPHDEIIISQYAYSLFKVVTQIAGGKCKVVPAYNWGHDLAAMAAAVNKKTKIIFLANPNNPTGTWITHNQLQSFLESIPSHILVVLDEAYFEYSTIAEYPKSVILLNDYKNLIITRTFSKIYGLAGLRIGYGIANTEVINILEKVRLTFNINSIAMIAALIAIEDKEHIQKSFMHNANEIKKLQAEILGLKLSYIPSIANFITVDLGQPVSCIYKSLLEEGIITRPLLNYGMPNHLRITIGTTEENIKFLSVFKNLILNQNRKSQ